MRKVKLMMMALMMCLGFMCFGQDRVNRLKLSYLAESAKPNPVIGWKFNENTGEWVDYKNMINGNVSYKTYITLNRSNLGFGTSAYTIMSGYNSFLSIQTKTIQVNQKIYYILVVEKFDGYYRYPNLEQDFISYKDTLGLIFDENEYNKLFTKDTLENSVKVLAIVKNGHFKENTFIDKLQSLNFEKESNYTFLIKRKNEIVRFYFPFDVRTYRYDFHYNPNFSKEYFETDTANFNILNKLSKQ